MALIRRYINIILLLGAANCVMLAAYFSIRPGYQVLLYTASALVLLLIGLFPVRVRNSVFRLRSIKKGHELIVLFSVTFLINTLANIVYGVLLVSVYIKWWVLAVNIAVCLLAGLVLLLTGLSRVFLTSLQLGIKWRVLIFFFWWVPGVNVFLLKKVCRLIGSEYEFETVKNELDGTRAENEICRTKYPLLMVHGVFFRDFRYFNYWGRIPKELRKNGAVIHLGRQQSAASVRDSAGELAEKIERIISETGCEKVNIIAHSKGGLDARCAVSRLGMHQYVATLTTVNTPHRGCLFADHLLKKAPEPLKASIARKYNAALRRLGDKSPDFIAAVSDLTAESCRKFNEETPDNEGVIYRSVASKMNGWTSGKFPLNISHLFVRPFDGENDGLVSVESARWGENCKIVTVNGKRGVSHGDMIDLNRENIPGFDVREFYVDLVRELKAMGV